MAAHREDGRGSEDRGEDNSEDTGDDRRRGRHSSYKVFKDCRERAPVAGLLRDPGGKRRVLVPALAQISLAEIADVAVTGVETRNTKIALQNPHLHPDHSRQNNLLLSLSQDHSISCFLQYIIRPQANPHRKNTPRSCLKFRPALAREKTSIVNATRPWTPRA